MTKEFGIDHNIKIDIWSFADFSYFPFSSGTDK
jgi:hypothetical protein